MKSSLVGEKKVTMINTKVIETWTYELKLFGNKVSVKTHKNILIDDIRIVEISYESENNNHKLNTKKFSNQILKPCFLNWVVSKVQLHGIYLVKNIRG